MSSPPTSRLEKFCAYFGFGATGGTPVTRKLGELKRRKTIHRIRTFVGFAGLAVILWLSLGRVGFSIAELVKYWPEFVAALGGYFPPKTYFGVVPFVDLGRYWQFIIQEDLFRASIVTLAMAFAGTVIGLPASLLLGVLASERVVPYPFNFVFRVAMSIIRAIPALVWALIFIPLGGVSPFTGMLAIIVETTGYLGRLFTDELEEIETGAIEGVRSTGASKSQIIIFGMLRQVFRQFVAWVAFVFEHNVRVAITLGLIGAGGLGYILQIQRQTFQYTNMMAAILVVVMLSGSAEILSQRVRSYLRDDETTESKGVFETFLGAPRKIAESTLK